MNLKKIKDFLDEIEISITTQTYTSSNDGDELILIARGLIEEVKRLEEKVKRWENIANELQEELIEKDTLIEIIEKANENLKKFKNVLMENSVVRAKRIEELEKALKEKNDEPIWNELEDV